MLSPSALVQHAAEHGLKVLALTDHDDTAGLAEAKAAADRYGIMLIPGVEISVTWRRRTLHIVGLKIDPTHVPLAEGLRRIRDGRHLRAQGMAASLERAGIQGSLEGAYRYAGDGIISRTHFARYLMELGYGSDMRKIFKRFLVKGKPGYVEHHWAGLEEAVGWILGAGGIAVMAHPGRYDMGRPTMLELLEAFRSCGGSAIEVVTSSHTPDQYLEYARIASMFGLRASQGSDYHGPGLSYMEMGRLPLLPDHCLPVWQGWPEAEFMTKGH
jgi:predicted metal-dependent phosphoesterase TrpH